MVKEAEKYREEDTKRKQHVEARNQAENLVFAVEKTLREQGEKITPELKREVEGKVEAVKKALEQDNLEAINQAATDLSQTIQKIGTQMYGEPGAASGSPPPGRGPTDQPGPDEGDVVEGEFSEAS